MRIGTLKETYIADAALFDSRTQKAVSYTHLTLPTTPYV